MNRTDVADETAPIIAAAQVERLLFTEYRCWMAGYSTRDISCWEIAWNALAAAIGVEAARPLYGEFHCFVRTLLQTAARDIGWRPTACRCLCRDEAQVLALVQASQQQNMKDEMMLASDLLGHGNCAALIGASRSLAQALTGQGLLLQRTSSGEGVEPMVLPAPRQLH
jgi:hypothetical protein